MGYLDGVDFYAEYSIEDQITHNVINFLTYGLLEIGAYYNINKGQLDSKGQDASLLRSVSVPGIANNRVWQGQKHNWVWESGIQLSFAGGTQPIAISGIYVDNVFVANNSAYAGTGWYIDYPRGCVIFAYPIGANSTVQVPHTERHLNVYSTDTQFYRDVVGFYQDRSNYTMAGSGLDGMKFANKAYLPAIFVSTNINGSVPIEIGSRSKMAKADIEFHVFAVNPSDRKKATDLCYNMEEKSIIVFNLNTIPHPLTVSGTIYPSSFIYPYLQNNYSNGVARFGGNAKVLKRSDVVLPIQYGKVSIPIECPVYL